MSEKQKIHLYMRLEIVRTKKERELLKEKTIQKNETT